MNYPTLTKGLRDLLDKNKITSELYKCSYCLSFHIAWMVLLLRGHGIYGFMIALIVAIMSYFLHLIEMILVKKSI